MVTAALSCSLALAQPPTPADIAAWSRAALPGAADTLRTYVALPNESTRLDWAAANAAWLARALADLEFAVELLPTPTAPFVYAERTIDPALPTLLFYLQVDGQPVDSAAWDQPDPYGLVVRRPGGAGFTEVPWDSLGAWAPDWRVYGRSASDSKGPTVALLTALRIIAAQGLRPAVNLRVIADLEEEISSPHLPALVRTDRGRFAADALVVMDGTRHVSNRPTLTFGARGIADVTLTAYGPREPLHSGQYGNYAPNPAFALARLLASLKDERGRVLIPGWYEGIDVSAADSAALAAIDDDEAALLRRLGIARPETVGGSYQLALQYPSLNVRGLRAAYVGEEVRTIIPEMAVAELDLRLVPETPGARQVTLLRDFVEAQGYFLLENEPTEAERAAHDQLLRFESEVAYEAFRTPLDAPVGEWLTAATRHALGEPPVAMRTTGGSQPMGPFITELGLDAVALRIPNPDNDIHAPNENLRLGNLLEGIQICVALLTTPYPK